MGLGSVKEKIGPKAHFSQFFFPTIMAVHPGIVFLSALLYPMCSAT